MKIQHWAIIFLIVVLPFSIVCRNVIKKKILVLNDETRYNNIVDNATYDAVSQIKEVAEITQLNKNVPLTENVVEASLDRFFSTLCVNFNLPTGRAQAEAYFGRYIPAIVFVGYDGLMVYSCEKTDNGYQFKLKPKIPYAKDYNGVLINYTLDNYVKIFVPGTKFAEGFPLEDGSKYGTNIIGGYVGEDIDFNYNGINDFMEDRNNSNFNTPGYVPGSNPYGISNSAEAVTNELATYVTSSSSNDGNLSYFLYEWRKRKPGATVPNTLFDLFVVDGQSSTDASFLIFNDNTQMYEPVSSNDFYSQSKASFKSVNEDYEFDENNMLLTTKAYKGYNKAISKFQQDRRETIINTIINTLNFEFNEHNEYARSLGVTYNFQIPNISRDQWNNSIDDVSVLAFIQGLPMGTDSYYNNYSLGGARIVQRNNVFCEVVDGGTGEYSGKHAVYHRYYCPLIPRDDNGIIVGSAGNSDNFVNIQAFWSGGVTAGFTFYNNYKGLDGSILKFPNGDVRKTTGVISIVLSESEARKHGFYPCRECCM